MYVLLYRIPTYKDIVQDDGEDSPADEGEGGDDRLVSTDEDEVDKQEQFERVYNFRFEEPGGVEVICVCVCVRVCIRACACACVCVCACA